MSLCFWRQLLLWYQCENKVQQRCLVARRAADQNLINSTKEMFQKRHQVIWGVLLVQTSQLDSNEHHIEPTDENRWEQMLDCIWRVIALVILWLKASPATELCDICPSSQNALRFYPKRLCVKCDILPLQNARWLPVRKDMAIKRICPLLQSPRSLN